MSGGVLGALAVRFFVIGFMAIGGVNATVPEIHRQVVEVERWMTDGEFAALFAIGNAAPGPNLLLVTLIGWHVAGVAGALVATTALIGPTSLLTFWVFRVWDRMRHAPWRGPVQNGLSAVTVGLVAASGYLLALAADAGWITALVTGATALVSFFRPGLSPLWIFAVAAAIGVLALT